MYIGSDIVICNLILGESTFFSGMHIVYFVGQNLLPVPIAKAFLQITAL